LQIKPDQRTRKYNIQMPFARVFVYNIAFAIPDGYTVEGLEKLNVSIERKSGGFSATATISGNQLVIATKKYYNHYWESADQWPDMLAFLDAAWDFSQQKILLKKK